ncbi:MAG: hypothetical protein Q7R35_09645 [Elusimicrobiota bacterium]|nr:hypothetical protein [Elusimicrobiota bacterium]
MYKRTAIVLGFLLAAGVSSSRADEIKVSDLQKQGFVIQINGEQISFPLPGQPQQACGSAQPCGSIAIANANGNAHATANANGNSHANANANGNSHANANANGNGHANANANGNAQANANANGNSHANANANGNGHANANANGNSNANANANGNSHANANANGNGHANANANGNSNANANANGNSHANANANGNSNANANANGNAQANANANGNATANANANSAACQAGGTNCYPPAPYPNPGYRQFSFDSGDFTFASDARKSMNNAIAELQRAGYPILEKRDNVNSYTLVFLATNYAGIKQYKSGQFTFLSDTEKAANEAVTTLRSRGMIVLEKKIDWTSFTVSYLNPGWN